MYEIFVESEDFRGKRQVQQHRLVNKVSILYMYMYIQSINQLLRKMYIKS